jgi:DNA-binding NtrC family response regulator
MHSILFVESDRELRKAAIEMLTKSGYTVIPAGDGREALGILTNRLVDLIISAVEMPYIDGVGLMEEIKRKKLGVPVIFLAASGDVESYMDLMNMGAFDYLNHPIHEQEILRVTRSALGEHSSGLSHYEFSSA